MAELAENVLRAVMVGLVNGTIYGLLGLGIVLIYKTQRVINFAQAEIATFGAFMLLLFHTGVGLPYPVAVVAAVAAAVLLALLIERVVIQPLRDAPDVTVFVATAGVALLLIALTLVVAGANPFNIAAAFGPLEQELLRRPLLGLVSPQRVIVLLTLVLAAVLLALFFRTTLGKGLLAMSVEPFAVRLAGMSTSRMSLLVWGLSGLLAGLAGVTYAPTVAGFTPGYFTSAALIPALTAVVIGGLTSLPGALVGGLVLGIAAEFAVLAGSTYAPAVPGIDTIAAFVLLLLTLLFRPQGLLGTGRA